MVGRRMLLIAAVMLFVISLAGALAPQPESPPPAVAAPVKPVPVATVRATLPRAAPVAVRAGDLVALSVRSADGDQVEVPGLGLSEPVGSGLVAEFTFLADRPGRFPVRLSLADREIGAIVVRER